MKKKDDGLVIFGTGNVGKAAYLILDKKVDFFINSRDKQKQGSFIDGIPIISLEESKLRLKGKSVVLGTTVSTTEEEMRNLLSGSYANQIVSISELICSVDLNHLGRFDQFDYSDVLDAILQEGLLDEYLYHIQAWEGTCKYYPSQLDGILKDYQIQGGKLADVACGYGFWSLFFAKKQFEVLGIDFNADRLNVFHRVAEKSPNMTAMNADIRNMNHIPDNSQDISFCAHTIHVVPNWRKVISEMNRITRSKGIIILVIARPDHLYYKNRYQGSSIMQWDATQENIIKAAAPDSKLAEVIDIYNEGSRVSNEAASAILIFRRR